MQDLLPPERDAGDRLLQLAAQPRRHLPVHARRITLPGTLGKTLLKPYTSCDIAYVSLCS